MLQRNGKNIHDGTKLDLVEVTLNKEVQTDCWEVTFLLRLEEPRQPDFEEVNFQLVV